MDQQKLLIIEEDRASRDALHGIFISRGWEVAMVTTEEQGLCLLGDYRPDWIIVAWQQLSGTGMAFFRSVRATGQGTRLAILTDELTSTERAMLRRLQPDAAFPKPFQPEVVFRTCAAGDQRLVTAG